MTPVEERRRLVAWGEVHGDRWWQTHEVRPQSEFAARRPRLDVWLGPPRRRAAQGRATAAGPFSPTSELPMLVGMAHSGVRSPLLTRFFSTSTWPPPRQLNAPRLRGGLPPPGAQRG